MFRWLIIGALLGVSCLAAPEPVEWRAAQIRAVLQEADEAYYNRGEPIMADEAYDALRAQYNLLQTEYPELPAYSDLGAPVPPEQGAVAHSRPMPSLKKAYSDEEVEAFIDTCGRDRLYCLEPKIDGLTIVLRYQNGTLTQALTRGDGLAGMDVTPQIMAAGCVPLALTTAPAMLEVRGEVFMPFEAFDALNARRIEAGQQSLKSPRNSAAGTLRLKDLAEVAQRGLQCRIFETVQAEPMPASHINGLALLRACGLPTVQGRAVPGAEVLPTLAELNQQRAAFPYPTDGVVIRLDDRSAFKEMGETARWPNGALARKYKPAPVETRLLGVEWMRGETGRLTPVARFEPVEVDGAEIQSASLHSLAHLRSLDLMNGDRIQVIRAGGAVPQILGRCPGARSGSEQPIPDPE